MRYGQDVFCNVTFLDKIIQERRSEPYKTLYQILFRLSDIYIDIDKDSLKAKINDNPCYDNLNKRDNKGLHDKSNWCCRIDLNLNSDQLYLIDPGYINDYKVKRTMNGALILADDDNDLKYFERICRLNNFALIPECERGRLRVELAESWEDVFKKQEMAPINSLIISDNYLFTPNFEDRKEYSLFNLLYALIPKDLDTDFHLTIFFFNENGLFTKQKAEQLIAEIKRLGLMTILC